MNRTYSELIRFDTFEERYRYLALRGSVGHSTFGFDRYLNQKFYRSRQWNQLRHHVIARDEGCDLGIEGYDIHSKLLIHHMNPLNRQDLLHVDDSLFDPEFLITTTLQTHNAIHYGDERQLPRPLTVRQDGDTKLW